MSLKIAIVALRRSPIRIPYQGGTEKFIYELAVGLQKRGHRLTVFASQDSQIPKVKVHQIPPFHTYDSTHAGLAVDVAKDLEHYRRIAYHIHQSSFDIVIDSSLKDGFLNFAPYLNVPVINLHHVPLEKSVLNTLIEEQNFFSKVEHVFVSRSMFKRQAGIINARVIHNGVDVALWRPPLSTRTRENTLCWSGRIVAEKGTHLALQAAKLTGLPLQFAGPVYDAQYFKERVEPLIDGKQIIYRGHLNSKELQQMVSTSRAALFTSVWDEPFGYVLAEAMACGTPVAGFASGAAPEVHSAKTAVLVHEYTASALAAAIPAALRLRSTDCVARAQKKFSLSTMVCRYEKLCFQLTRYASHSRYPQLPTRRFS